MTVNQITQSKTKAAWGKLCKNSGLTAMAVLTLILGSGLAISHGAKPSIPSGTFLGTKAGDEITVGGIKLCWCPAGKFMMGSPRDEPERRPDEDQVEVTLTKGFWMAKFEVTQGQWKRAIGELPGPLTEQLPEGDEFPVGNVNFAEAEAFCRKLTQVGRQSGNLPKISHEDGHVVRRQTQQQAGELQRQALQWSRIRTFARSGCQSRQLSSQSLGLA